MITDTLAIIIERADYDKPDHAAAIVSLLRAYARDPMGGGKDIPPHVQHDLVAGLRAMPNAFSVLAFVDNEPVGLTNCFFGFSTFAARPLVNIHDMVVLKEYRGIGIGRKLFGQIESIARAQNACKITLEVLDGNESAKALYASLGYGDYILAPEQGRALFWQKGL